MLQQKTHTIMLYCRLPSTGLFKLHIGLHSDLEEQNLAKEDHLLLKLG
jgi:hypothetical protein